MPRSRDSRTIHGLLQSDFERVSWPGSAVNESEERDTLGNKYQQQGKSCAIEDVLSVVEDVSYSRTVAAA